MRPGSPSSRPVATVTFTLALSMGLSSALAPQARAQQLPSVSDPSRLQERFKQPETPQSKPAISFPAPEQAPPPEQAAGVHFTLHGVVVDGATVFGEADLKPFYQKLLDREVSLLDLYKVRDAVTAKYRNDGYILSQAVIPAQKIDAAGVVHLKVVEGSINEVRFQGAFNDRFDLLPGYAEKIKASKPLTESVLERYVLLIGDLAGVKVKTVLEPVEKGGVGSNLTIVMDRTPIDASFTIDNRGSPAIGPIQMDGEVNVNDLLGQFDRTTIRGILTPHVDELRYIDVSHVEPIGTEGMTLEIGALRNWSDPGFNIRKFDIKSQSTTLHGTVMYPVIRSRSETLRLTGEFSYRNDRTNSFGQAISDDRERFLSVGSSYDFADGLDGSNLIQLQVDKGLDILNASSGSVIGQSRFGAPPDFTKYTISAQHNQPLPAQFSLLLATSAQYSPDKLVSSDQFSVGGKLFGRGFDSSEVTGDSGAEAKVELQYTPDFGVSFLDYVQFFSYYDYGSAFKYDDVQYRNWQSLASVGAGVRFSVTQTVSGELQVAKPLMRDASATGNRDPRGFFSLTARY